MDLIINKLEKLDFSQPLSFKTIRNRTKVNGKLINKKLMLAILYKSDKYRKINPLEVGSGKYKLNVWAKK